MNISLTPTLEGYIESKVESGLYNSSSEVVREALRQMILTESQPNQPHSLDQKIAVGLQQLDSGDFITDEQLNQHIKNRRNTN